MFVNLWNMFGCAKRNLIAWSLQVMFEAQPELDPEGAHPLHASAHADLRQESMLCGHMFPLHYEL